MKYYDLTVEKRELKKQLIKDTFLKSIIEEDFDNIIYYFDDKDTYIRKVSYQAIGKLYFEYENLRGDIIKYLNKLFNNSSERVRQTVIYACGEIAVKDLYPIEDLLENVFLDIHHSVRNAVTGSLKFAGNKNSDILKFCDKYIESKNPEVRKLASHGLELHGRTKPQNVINILKKLQYDESIKVNQMLIHILGQISYKKGCFHYVVGELKTWENQNIFEQFKEEVIEVHGRYEKFSEFSQEYVIDFFK